MPRRQRTGSATDAVARPSPPSRTPPVQEVTAPESGGVSAAWARMFAMVNEATCAALAPAFVSTSLGATSPSLSSAEAEPSPPPPNECSDEDSSSYEGFEEKVEGEGVGGTHVDFEGSSSKRARSGRDQKASFGDSEDESVSPPSITPRGNFHGYPCPRCGVGVGFNAKKCKGCNQVCAYATACGGRSSAAGSSRTLLSSGNGAPRNTAASTKNRNATPAGVARGGGRGGAAKKRPRSDRSASTAAGPKCAAREGHMHPHVDGKSGGGRACPSGEVAGSPSGLLNADGLPIYVTTGHERSRTTGGTAASALPAHLSDDSPLLLGASSKPSSIPTPKSSGGAVDEGADSSSGPANSTMKTWCPPTMTPATATGIAVPPPSDPHPELLSPLLSSSLGKEGLRSYIVALRTESVQRVARPLLTRIMAHSLNRGLFNEPVDAAKMGLVDYHAVVKCPMDLGTVKGKLLSMQYDQLEPFVADVRLAFANAMRYNPPHTHVNKAAHALSLEFEDELKKLAKKLERDEKRRVEHSCSLCQGQECGLCGEKCLKLEPVMLQCSGACNQRIKRGAPFYITRDGARLWCQKCHTGLSSVLPPSAATGDPDLDVSDPDFTPHLFYKRDLLKRVNDEDIPEPWVMCDSCQGWFHQSCTLYNKLYEQGLGDARDSCVFCCPLCRLGSEAKRLPPPWLHQARNWFADLAAADSSSPANGGSSGGDADLFPQSSSSLASSSSMVSFSVPASSASSSSSSSRPASSSSSSSWATGGESPFGQSSVGDTTTEESWDGSNSDTEHCGGGGGGNSAESARRGENARSGGAPAADPLALPNEIRWDAPSLPTTEMSAFLEGKVRWRLGELGFANVAESVVIRLISSTDRCFAVAPPVRKNFSQADGSDLPETLTYKSKAVGMFQRQDGADICLFAMYVQEYGDGPSDGDTRDGGYPEPNKRQVYISYLDSVEYFRPRTADSHVRTAVYHEIIVAYLAWARMRGFERAHLWACPPQRGNNFIFWCHPTHQRTPSKERLLQWYKDMVLVAAERGVVTAMGNYFDEYFAPLVGPNFAVPAEDEASHASGTAGDGAGGEGAAAAASVPGAEDAASHAGESGGGASLLLAAASKFQGSMACAGGGGGRGFGGGRGRGRGKMGKSSGGKGSKSGRGKGKGKGRGHRAQVPLTGAAASAAATAAASVVVPAPLSVTSRSVSSATFPLACSPPLFEGDFWIDESCRLFGLRQRRKVTLSEDASAHQLATAFVRTLRLHPCAHAFNQPVDPEALNIPDYTTVIKRPMDLSTITAKLKSHSYPQMRDMLEDVLLMLDNAKLYNPDKHPVHLAACTLKAHCDREWAALRARWHSHQAAAAVAARERHERQPPISDLAYAWLRPGGGGARSAGLGGGGGGGSSSIGFGGCCFGEGCGLESSPPSPSSRLLNAKPASAVSPVPSLDGCSSSGAGGVMLGRRLTRGRSDPHEGGLTQHEREHSSASSDSSAGSHNGGRPRSRLSSSASDCMSEGDVDEVLLMGSDMDDEQFDTERGQSSRDGSCWGCDPASPSSSCSVGLASSSANLSSFAPESHPFEQLHRAQSNDSAGSAALAGPASGAVLAPRQNWLLRDVAKSVHKLKDDLLVLHLRPEAAPPGPGTERGLRQWAAYTAGARVLPSQPLSGSALVSASPPSPSEPGSLAPTLSSSSKSPRMRSSKGATAGSAGAAEAAPAQLEPVSSAIAGGEARPAMPPDPDQDAVTRPLVDGRHTMLEVSMFRHLQFDSLRRAKHGTAMLLYHLHFPSHSLDAHCSGCREILEGLRWHCAACTDYDVCGLCSKRSNMRCPEEHPLTPYHVSSFEIEPPMPSEPGPAMAP